MKISASLVRSRDRALREGVALALVCSNRSVLRPMDLTGLLELFAVSESIETALGAFPS
jgi:anti-anti-sigma regulatory factor